MNVKQGRPIVGMCQKIAPEILARIKALKGEREEWGAKSIWYELVHREAIIQVSCPVLVQLSAIYQQKV